MAYVQIQRALVKLHLNGIIADVGKRQAALSAHTKDAGAGVQFGTGFLIGPDVVRIRQWTVQRSGNPVAGALRLKRHGTRHVLETHGASGRISARSIIVLVLRGARRRRSSIVLLN